MPGKICGLLLFTLVFTGTLIAQTGDREVRDQIGDDIRFPALPYYSYG